MKAEQLRELGFKLIDEYVHGDNNEFVTQTLKKGIIHIDLDYVKGEDKVIHNDICIEIDVFENLTLKELTQLDKILNK